MIPLHLMLSALLAHAPDAACVKAMRAEVKARRNVTPPEKTTYIASTAMWGGRTITITAGELFSSNAGPCDGKKPDSARYECLSAEARKEEERQAKADAEARKRREEQEARERELAIAIARVDEVCGAL